MPEDILSPEDEGVFAWLSRPRRVALNLLRQEYGMAGQQALDFLANIPDAVLPGDAIPEFSGPESDIEVGDLAGMEPGWKKTVVDVVGGIPLDPLTYVPFGKVAQKVAGAANTGVRAVGGGKILDKSRNAIVDTMNWHQLTPQQRAMETAAKSAGATAARASEVRAKQLLEGLEQPEQEAIFDAIQNVTIDPVTKQAKILTKPRLEGWWSTADNVDEALASLRETPTYKSANPAAQARMEERTKGAVELGQTQFDEALNVDPLLMGKSEGPYAKRSFMFEDAASPAASKARAAKRDVELAATLNADPAVAQAYSRDLQESLLRRASEQGRFATKKSLGDSIMAMMGKGSYDPTKHSGEVSNYLDELIKANGPERDFAVRAKGLFTGIGKMNPLNEALAKFNSNIFKPAATVGVIVPRVSFGVRNSLSSIVQALSTPGARGAALKDPSFFTQRVLGGIADPIDEAVAQFSKTGKRIITDDTNRLLANLEEAFAQSKGSVEATKNFLRKRNGPMDKEALQALEQNVLENPVRVDEVMAELRPDGSLWQTFKEKSQWDLPAKLNKHMEDRIRAGLFVAAKRAGQSDAAAAASVRNAVLDYSVPTIENRVMRTWIPFGAFMSQTLPQSTKLLMENAIEGGVPGALAGGAARGAATQMFETDPENPIYPDMVGKMTVPMGDDEQGNAQYLTSLGLPLEGMGDLPMSFAQRDLERFIGVGANPLVKAGYSMVTGREPFFGTPYGGYDKPYAAAELLGMERGPAAATVRQVLGTGALQPVVHGLNLVEPWLDERQGPGLDAVRAFTGARVRSVDEDMALRLNLEEALRNNPQVKQYSGFYAGAEDEATQDLMADYNEAKRRITEKRKAAKEAAAATVQ